MTLPPMPLLRSRGVAAAGGFAAVRPTRNANPSVSLPQTGQSPAWVSPAPPDWSGWQQFTAGEASSYILDKLNLDIMAIAPLNWWVQLGVGAAPDEVPFATFGGTVLAGGTDMVVAYPVQFNIDGYHLPAGTRLAIRSQDDNAVGASKSRFSAIVVAMPDPPLFSANWDEKTYRQGGVASIVRYPAVAGFTSVTAGGSANSWGAWVEFIASAPNRLQVYTLHDSYAALLIGAHRFQVGIGALGEEVAQELTATPRYIGAGVYGVGCWRLSRSVEVLTGERVSVRHANYVANRVAKVALDAYNLNF